MRHVSKYFSRTNSVDAQEEYQLDKIYLFQRRKKNQMNKNQE